METQSTPATSPQGFLFGVHYFAYIATDNAKPIVCLVIGMAGSGKTTLLQVSCVATR